MFIKDLRKENFFFRTKEKIQKKCSERKILEKYFGLLTFLLLP